MQNKYTSNNFSNPQHNRTSQGMIPVIQLRQCRICLQLGNADNLIQPCKCTGTLQFVHQLCLKQWIKRIKRPGQSSVQCQLCKNIMQFHVNIQKQCVNKQQFEGRIKGHQHEFICQIIVLLIVVGVLIFLINVMATNNQEQVKILQLCIFGILSGILFFLIILTLMKIINHYLMKNTEEIGKILKCKQTSTLNSNNNNSMSRVYPQTIIIDLQ